MTGELEPKTWYYYYRDSKHRPVVTVCLMEFAGSYYRGVAICSVADMPVKARGRAIARGRACRALNRGLHSPLDLLPMTTDKARNVFARISGYLWTTPAILGGKSVPTCRLTDFERRLVERKNNG